jgi:uncharacterized paraquat-inducible protein A
MIMREMIVVSSTALVLGLGLRYASISMGYIHLSSVASVVCIMAALALVLAIACFIMDKLSPKERHDKSSTSRSWPGNKPCPYCGQILRTDDAMQCFECGKDWHKKETESNYVG